MRSFLNSAGCLLLCLLLVLSFSSCSSDEAPEVFDVSFDGGGDYNALKGMEFTLCCGGSESLGDNYLGFQDDSPFALSLIERVASIEKACDCSVTVAHSDSEDVKIKLMCGIHPGDIMYGICSGYRELAAGLCLPVDDYTDVIDYTDSFRWGAPGLLESGMVQGTMYVLYPICMPGQFAGFYAIIISNNDILSKHSYSNPHELVENGVWTSDKLVEIATNCSDMDRGIYGFETFSDWFFRQCFFSNGVHYTKVTEDGRYVNGLDTINAVNALTWGKEFYDGFKPVFSNDGGCNNFLEGRSALCMQSANIIMGLTYSEFIKEFSVLPFPSGPDVEYGYSSGYFWGGCSGITLPVTQLNITEAAQMLDLLFAPLEGTETYDSLCDYYAKNIFFDRRDIETLFKAINNSECSYIAYRDLPQAFLDALVIKSRQSGAAAAVDSISSSFSAEIEEIIVPNRIGLKNYFGYDIFP